MKDDKLRDMIRSILPSRYRSGSKWDKAVRKRAHRRCVRIDVRYEDYEETVADLLRDVRVSDIVQERRGGDKLNHFIRWCERLTEGMARADRLSAVRAMLPASLIGDHAYLHWKMHLRPRQGRGVPYRELERRKTQSANDSDVFRLRRALRTDPSLHARLNAELKAWAVAESVRARLLYGMHDVEAFVHEIYGCGERAIVLRLIAETEGRPKGRPSLYAC